MRALATVLADLSGMGFISLESRDDPAKTGKQWSLGAATQSSNHRKGNSTSSGLLSCSKCFGLYTVLLSGFAVVKESLIIALP